MANREVSDKMFGETLKSLAKSFGGGYDHRGALESSYKAIPTGHDDLDDLLTKGTKGIYKGGIIELMGSEGSGKTSLALRTVGNAQRMGDRCCWIDAEAGFDPTVAEINNCDPASLVMPDLADTRAVNDNGLNFFNASEVLEMIYRSVVSNVFGLVVLDSVAGLMPERILQDNFDGNQMGVSEVARSMASGLGKIAQACSKTETSVIFINQLRDKPGEYFHDRFHTPGGRALKFFAHQRISVEKIKGVNGRVVSIDNGKEELIGHYAKVTIVKNKKAPPIPEGMTIEVPIYYCKYNPDIAKRCYDLARALQVITIRNGILTWKDNDETVLNIEGESEMLAKIRSSHLESRLASCLITAESSEKNQSKKVPVKVSSSIRDVAVAYISGKKKTVTK